MAQSYARIQDRTSDIENLKELALDKLAQILGHHLKPKPKPKPTAPTVIHFPKSPRAIRLWRRPEALHARIDLALFS